MIHEVVHPTNNPDVTLTTYVHDRSDELANVDLRPAVLVLPGGGYEFCSDREAEPIALALAGAGYQAFVLRYSVAEDAVWPAPLQDAEAGLQAIIDNAERWGVEAGRIAVIGFSAGGHLAASLCIFGRVRPAAMMLVYPATSLETLWICHPATHTAPDLLAAVDESCPPAFLVHTAADEVVPVTDSLWLAERLATSGVPFELHVFPTGLHGLALASAFTSTGRPEVSDETFASWLGLAVDWLGRQFPVA